MWGVRHQAIAAQCQPEQPEQSGGSGEEGEVVPNEDDDVDAEYNNGVGLVGCVVCNYVCNAWCATPLCCPGPPVALMLVVLLSFLSVPPSGLT